MHLFLATITKFYQVKAKDSQKPKPLLLMLKHSVYLKSAEAEDVQKSHCFVVILGSQTF